MDSRRVCVKRCLPLTCPPVPNIHTRVPSAFPRTTLCPPDTGPGRLAFAARTAPSPARLRISGADPVPSGSPPPLAASPGARPCPRAQPSPRRPSAPGGGRRQQLLPVGVLGAETLPGEMESLGQGSARGIPGRGQGRAPGQWRVYSLGLHSATYGPGRLRNLSL